MGNFLKAFTALTTNKFDSVVDEIKELKDAYVKAMEKIEELENEIETNKSEKEKELEQKIEQLRVELSRYSQSQFVYGFSPKELDFITKWHNKHYEENSTGGGIRHAHLSYTIDIFPETVAHTAKCATCGTYITIYDEDLLNVYEYTSDKKRKKISFKEIKE